MITITMVEKGVTDYIGWCSQSTKREDFGRRYAGSQYTDTRIRICGYVYANMDTGIRIRGYGYADTDMRIQI